MILLEVIVNDPADDNATSMDKFLVEAIALETKDTKSTKDTNKIFISYLLTVKTLYPLGVVKLDYINYMRYVSPQYFDYLVGNKNMTHSHKHGADHKGQLTRVNKIEGQVRGIKKMIENEKYCVDILTQIKAARSALKSLELSVLEGHLNHCLLSAIEADSKKDALDKVDEILDLLKKTSKS